jgi:hypothetical protein
MCDEMGERVRRTPPGHTEPENLGATIGARPSRADLHTPGAHVPAAIGTSTRIALLHPTTPRKHFSLGIVTPLTEGDVVNIFTRGEYSQPVPETPQAGVHAVANA